MLVLKFGGSSVANADIIKQVKAIISKLYSPESGLIVVVSAFSGVTDLLIEATNKAENNNPGYKDSIHSFFRKAHQIAGNLLTLENYDKIKNELQENHLVLDNILGGVVLIQEASKKTRDYILSFGERNCAFILNEFLAQEGLQTQYIDTRKYIKTDDTFGSARVNYNETNKLINDAFAGFNKIGIATGFIGSDLESGRTTTLGRGGSDYSAAIFASALNATELQIWTDVSGVLTSDPRKVSKAYPIKELSYAEAMEMSHFGAKVLYFPTIRPVKEKGIPTRIKNTLKPDDDGTLIHNEKSKGTNIISGLSSISNIALISIEGTGLQGVSGIANRLFKSLAAGNINVVMITQASSEHSITVAINDDESSLAKQQIENEFAFELDRKLIDPIKIDKNLCLVAAIGQNMKNSPGVSGRLFQTLGKNGINIEAIAQGSSELNITFAISKENELKALNTLHDCFFLSEYKTIHLFIIGVGLIGKTLINQIIENKERILEDSGIEIVVDGLSNSKKMCLNNDGIDLTRYKECLEKSEDIANISTFILKMKKFNLAHSIFIDNTASAKVPTFYPEILKNNIAISTPNKIALSSDLETYKNIKRISSEKNVPFRFETNVGAGLPVMSTLQNLVSSGDKIIKIEAVLSGSLSYIFNTFNSSLNFSSVIKDAQNQGFTEPDPREDLSGADVRRKLLILSRESGFDMHESDIKINNFLSSAAINAKNVDLFYEVIENEANLYSILIKEAEDKNERLRFIACLENGIGTIGLRSISSDSPFYTLNGSDNMIVFHTHRYNKTPLVVRGPGAGADVTAAGVLAEIINIASFI
jgi:aspartokinase/homoserine dehydrogenase 1